MHSTGRDDVAKTPPFSRIVYHFSTLRRNEPYSGGIGLIKSIVKPFLARGLNETPISLREPIYAFNSIDKTKNLDKKS